MKSLEAVPSFDCTRRQFLQKGGFVLSSLIAAFCLGCQPPDQKLLPTPTQTSSPTAAPVPATITPKPASVIDQYAGVKRNPALGIRNDHFELMEWVPKIGASMVRIVGDRDNFYKNLSIKQAISAAHKANLDILYTYNPQKLLPFRQMKKEVLDLIGFYPLKAIELCNEADNGIPFWQDRDLGTLAVFTAVAADLIHERSPKTQVGIGAFVEPGRLKELLEYLKEPDFTRFPDYDNLTREEKNYLGTIRFDPSRCFYSVHAYHTVEDVLERVEAAKKVFDSFELTDARVWLTEVGTSKQDKSIVTEMMDAFYGIQGIIPEKAIIHELPDYEKFGLVNPKTKLPIKSNFDLVSQWSQRRLAMMSAKVNN